MLLESTVRCRSLARSSASARRSGDVRALGLDIGEKRIGVAVSDPSGSVATPVKVIATAEALGDARVLRRLVDDYEVELIVIGLPLSLDGSEGPQALQTRSTGDRLVCALGVQVEYFDERLSSAQAKRAMTDAGVSDKGKRGSVDMVAAAIFLQSYLDSRRIAEGDAS